MYIDSDAIERARQMDLLTYLQHYEPNELVHLHGNVYCTATHDSLKISNGKWMWWSRGFGGVSALDYLIKVCDVPFLKAVERISGSGIILPLIPRKQEPPKERKLILPDKSDDFRSIEHYLCNVRKIDREVFLHLINAGLIYESMPYHNCIFLGMDEINEPRYAAYRASSQARILGDCPGSDKHYSFRIGENMTDTVHIFECAIDAMSYASMAKMNGEDFRKMNLVSLAGVYAPNKDTQKIKVPVALTGYLERHPDTKKIVIHFDNDDTGRGATIALTKLLSEKYEVVDEPPKVGKDMNDFLIFRRNTDMKRRLVYER